MQKQTVPLGGHTCQFINQFAEALNLPMFGGETLLKRAILEPISPFSTDDTEEFRDLYWYAESFSKLDVDLGIDREAAARSSFIQSEAECQSTNRRMVWGGFDFPELRKARRLVHEVLGKQFPWNDWMRHCSFGPGATTSRSRANASQQNKWLLAGHITESALPYFSAWARFHSCLPHDRLVAEVVPGNKVTYVPKNAKTHRVIAMEPDWNMFFQRGVGGCIRQRLQSRLGLLRPDAQDVNREAARQGSLHGHLATLDLKGASDTIALGLVESLLPANWVRVLNALRSPVGTMPDGVNLCYDKVSSMGNGFTFELETLIFWALATAVSEKGKILVYGDDIICHVEDASKVVLMLDVCGFSTNSRKSFTAGPFRESCGGHYHLGRDVTPPYFKESLDSEAGLRGQWIRVKAANKLRARAKQRYGYPILDGRFRSAWDWLTRDVSRRFYGPEEMGDACLHVPFDQARPTWDRNLQKWKVKTFTEATDPYVTHLHWGAVFSSLHGKVDKREVEYRTPDVVRVSKSQTYVWNAPDTWLV